MSIFEYNEELHLQNVRQDGIDEATAKAAVIIAEKDATIAEKDSQITDMRAEITELKAKLAGKNNSI